MTCILNYYDLMCRKAQTRRELSSLSDRELADIGLKRADIDQIVKETR